jgi:hypothetical protein
VVLLEQALRYSPYNYHFRVMLLGLYRSLGAFCPAVDHYNHLEVMEAKELLSPIRNHWNPNAAVLGSIVIMQRY